MAWEVTMPVRKYGDYGSDLARRKPMVPKR